MLMVMLILGNATSDTITATGRFDSDLVPSTDGARDPWII